MGTEEASPGSVTLDAEEWRHYQEYVEGLEQQQIADGIELGRLRPLVERLEREEAERKRHAEMPTPTRFSWAKTVAFTMALLLAAANVVFAGLFIARAVYAPFLWVLVGLTVVSLVLAARAFWTRSLLLAIVCTLVVAGAFGVTLFTTSSPPASVDEFVLSVTMADGEPAPEWSVVVVDSVGNEKFRQAVTAENTYWKYSRTGLLENDTIIVQTTVPGTKCSLSLDRTTLAQAVYTGDGPLDCRYTVPAA